MDGVFEKAVSDYFNNTFNGPLVINNYYGEADEMPLDVYFRDGNELDGLESYALSLCKGTVLDVGAGVGAMSLILKERDIDVDALEISNVLCDIMHARGVVNVLKEDFFSFQKEKKYDTLLMMMNGFGIGRTLDKLSLLFERFDQLLNPGGQVLFDSSDVRYLYEDKLPDSRYYGEIDYQYEYQGEKGPWFTWLYIDSKTLTKAAERNGFQLQVLSEDSNGQYLGRLIRV